MLMQRAAMLRPGHRPCPADNPAVVPTEQIFRLLIVPVQTKVSSTAVGTILHVRKPDAASLLPADMPS